MNDNNKKRSIDVVDVTLQWKQAKTTTPRNGNNDSSKHTIDLGTKPHRMIWTNKAIELLRLPSVKDRQPTLCKGATSSYEVKKNFFTLRMEHMTYFLQLLKAKSNSGLDTDGKLGVPTIATATRRNKPQSTAQSGSLVILPNTVENAVAKSKNDRMKNKLQKKLRFKT